LHQVHYYAGVSRLAETAAPNTKNRSHRIGAVIEMPHKGGEGVIAAEGGARQASPCTYRTANSSITTTGSDGKPVGSARIKNTVAGRFGIDTFGVGSDTGSPVANTYKPPFAFTGKIERVDIELGPRELSREDEKRLHEMHTAFAGAHD
jgi:hypothetical protein